MKRDKNYLENIKTFIEGTYNGMGSLLIVNKNKKLDPYNPEVSYSFRYEDKKDVIYKVVISKLGEGTELAETEFRFLLHEYGHIYLGHLDGIHEELDRRVCTVFKNFRGDLIEQINANCGIDFAEKLIEQVIDNPAINHTLHGIAMDLEVNSSILSTEDVDEMQADVSSLLPKDKEELIKWRMDQTNDPELKEHLQKALEKIETESKIKLMVPERFHLADGSPFPENLKYPEYLMLMIKHLDQFVKMLVSIKLGGNGDTSGITADDIKDVLLSQMKDPKSNSNDPGDPQAGSQDSPGMDDLNSLMQDLGITDGTEKDSSSGQEKGDAVDSPYSGKRGGDGDDTGDLNAEGDQPGGMHRDHGTEARDEADEKRRLGQIRSEGGHGCSAGGRPSATRQVTNQDAVDMALEEVIVGFKSRVFKMETKKDTMYLYNRGINRTVIASSLRHKNLLSTEPTIVFLIDISGSMDTRLVDRILKTISNKMGKINRGLKYNIITWSTQLGEHIKNIEPRKGVPRISMGGGTRMAKGIEYFRDNYSKDAILILISDFEDYLEEWHNVEKTMSGYTMYGFNYGSSRYNQAFSKNFTVKNFKNYGH